MFNNKNFYPTPEAVFQQMINGYDIENKIVLEPLYPVGGCLLILAENKREATKIAKNTITHTAVFEVKKKVMKKGVVIYKSGNY